MKATSHIFSTMRGKVGGIVYTTTPDAQITARAYAVPVNPNTNGQGKVRGCLAAAVALWAGLGDETRLSWQLYAQANQGVSSNGRKLFIATQVAINQALNSWTQGNELTDPLSTPPNVTGTAYVTYEVIPFTGAVNHTGVSVKFTNSLPFIQYVLLQISGLYSPARGRFGGPWDTSLNEVVKVDANDAATFTLQTDAQTDTTMFVRFRPVLQLRGTPPAERGDIIGAREIVRLVTNLNEA